VKIIETELMCITQRNVRQKEQLSKRTKIERYARLLDVEFETGRRGEYSSKVGTICVTASEKLSTRRQEMDGMCVR